MTSVARLLLIILLITLTSGCPSWWTSDVKEKTVPPEELFTQGKDKIKEKKYDEAINILERLKSAYPEFKQIPEVYLAIADSFYDEGSYDRAIARYLQFLELYPAHKDAARAKYQIGMSYFSQIKNTDLDNSVVKQAIRAFKAVSDAQDTGEWGKKAEEKSRECQRKLAEKELYKARSYISLSNYKAARISAQRVIDEFSKLGLDEEAKQILANIKNK